MKLDHVRIINFRSIKDVTIDFKEKCRTLVGINESGKSNILKALSLLDPGNLPKKSDQRYILRGEDPITESNVKFVFQATDDEIRKVILILESDFLYLKQSQHFADLGGKVVSLSEYCNKRNELIVIADLIEEKRHERRWGLREGWKLIDSWKEISDECPIDFKISIDGKEIELKKFKYIDSKLITDIPVEFLNDVDLDVIDKHISEEFRKMLSESYPKVFFWDYKPENILPSSVKIDEFLENPDTCLPLKNMFILAGYIDIKKSVNEQRSLTSKGLKNLLENVSFKSTTFLHEIWKWESEIGFEIYTDGNDLKIGIKEINSYDMGDRSDGFKRFVTFLLMISSIVEKDVIVNALILIDEPDISLDPPGARNLRDELLRISKKNYVVFSTHSIFMIDRDNIERHIIVTKETEITSTETAYEDNLVKEEVLFNSLGHSVFSSLKTSNIIFEGWDDSLIFELMTNRIPSAHSSLKTLQELGITYAKGASRILSITPVLKLAERKCYVISDADSAGKDNQKQFCDENGYGTWLRYDELCSKNILTLEDFIIVDALIEACKKLRKIYKDLPLENTIDFTLPGGNWEKIVAWISKNPKLNTKELKVQAKKEYKEILYKSIKKSDILGDYYEFLEKLQSFIQHDDGK